MASGLRFNLKSTLAVLTASGAVAGLLGRMYLNDPQRFFSVCRPLITIAPFVAAIVTILWLGRQRKAYPLIAWGIVLGLVPLLGSLFLGLLQSAGGSGSGVGLLPNQQILQVTLPKTIDQPGIWRELGRRVDEGDLSKAEVDTAIQKLAAFLITTRPTGSQQPLTWQDDFLEKVVAEQMVSDGVLCGLVDTLPDDLTMVDIELSPNAAASKQFPWRKKMWGKREVIINVPLERIDLETASGSPVVQ